ncbi:MAG: metal-sensitive transcriptional regulator [Patescibacteria group bacterium]|nr:metal-sensitive transcriptional regulator [Patescibacteria group bacterium]MDD5121372.1 metal-sensitive transcriptional regulator [Patescibacteria group bacterium]MDD5221779.1 metal-sensitive transcriptional regulator [Patescibacteria group bacterium]MDD5395709.1 metal-sensitive transcriptional regulator [Patescibacteria group bacterium]
MKSIIKKQVLNRMNYLKGHLEGVRQMVADDVYCINVIKQNLAVIAALRKVNDIILANHLNTCVTTVIKSNNEQARKKMIKELLTIFTTNHNC